MHIIIYKTNSNVHVFDWCRVGYFDVLENNRYLQPSKNRGIGNHKHSFLELHKQYLSKWLITIYSIGWITGIYGELIYFRSIHMKHLSFSRRDSPTLLFFWIYIMCGLRKTSMLSLYPGKFWQNGLWTPRAVITLDFFF